MRPYVGPFPHLGPYISAGFSPHMAAHLHRVDFDEMRRRQMPAPIEPIRTFSRPEPVFDPGRFVTTRSVGCRICGGDHPSFNCR